MKAAEISPFRRVMTAFLAIVLVMGLTPSGAWASEAATAGGESNPASALSPAAVVGAQDGSALDTLSGTGTETDPYQLKTAADFTALQMAVNEEGNSCEGLFFKQTANVTLPSTEETPWAPIGCLIDPSVGNIGQDGANMRAFSGTFNGNSKTVTVPEGSKPLFGYVKGATIRNLNVSGKRIEGYGLINNMEGVGLSGDAVLVENVTLKKGTKTLKSGILGCVITSSTYSGVSASYVATIKDCTVEAGVEIGYDGTQSEIGSIVGRLNGTVENCTSAATVKGVNCVGGIVGAKDNSMGLRNTDITGCAFTGTVEATGQYVGGIMGSGYLDTTAPNAHKPTIEGCSVSGSVVGVDRVGGIYGGDPVVQSWATTWDEKLSTIANNTFKGTVAGGEGAQAVGAIVGYYANLNKCDIIKDNVFASGYGATKAFGTVVSVDTSNAAYPNKKGAPYGDDVATGAYYYNSAGMTDQYKAAVNAAMREKGLSGSDVKQANHNRTDDPLGADADKIANDVLASFEGSGTIRSSYKRQPTSWHCMMR